jgi:hypothetical protein
MLRKQSLLNLRNTNTLGKTHISLLFQQVVQYYSNHHALELRVHRQLRLINNSMDTHLYTPGDRYNVSCKEQTRFNMLFEY